VTLRAYLARIARYLSQAPRGSDYKRAVFATFQTAIRKAEEEAPGAAAMLSLASFFAPDNVPDELLRQAAQRYDAPAPALPDASTQAFDLRSTVEDPIPTDEAIGALDRLSLVAYNPDAQAFSVHRLVAAASRDLIAKNVVRWSETALLVIEAAFPKLEFRSWGANARSERTMRPSVKA